MFAKHEDLTRIIISSLGAALFSISCLLAAAGPAQAGTPTAATPALVAQVR